MTQHRVDLLPDFVLARSQAGVRAGRYVAAVLIAIAAVTVAGTHFRLALRSGEAELVLARRDADTAIEMETRAAQLRETLNALNADIVHYDAVALPMPVHKVVATIVEELPPSVVLDVIDIDTGVRRAQRGPRTASNDEIEQAPRILIGEISGFAASDEEITELVMRLDDRLPFYGVSLDFTRTRTVRDRLAREFRVSFRIDLDRRYVINDPSLASASGKETEVADE